MEKGRCKSRSNETVFLPNDKGKNSCHLQEQWVKKDKALFNTWVDEKGFHFIPRYKFVSFKNGWIKRSQGQFSTPALIKPLLETIANLAQQDLCPSSLPAETKKLVGPKENVQVSKPNTKIDSKDDMSNECFNDNQD